jgi:Secretion system C-terminal sorting domain/Beta-propeller repeat
MWIFYLYFYQMELLLKKNNLFLSKKWILLGFFFFRISNLALAQYPTTEWVRGFGGFVNEENPVMVSDSIGNVYIAGGFVLTVDFDPGVDTFNLTSVGNKDIFVLKLDQAGDFLWVKQFGGTQLDWVYDIALDLSGNIYFTGFFKGTADFDPGPGTSLLVSTGLEDIFVCKLNTDGNLLWARQMGGSGVDYSTSIKVADSNQVNLTGIFQNTADFDPGPGILNLSAVGPDHLFSCQLDRFGSIAWAKEFGNTSTIYTERKPYLTTDILGFIYITGGFFNIADFFPGPGVFNLQSFGSNDIYVLKLDSLGNFLWAKQMGGNDSDEGRAIEVGLGGTILTSGKFRGTADFDPATGFFLLTTPGTGIDDHDNFISTLDANGNFLMARQIGGWNLPLVNSITTDHMGSIYLTGQFKETVDFDPGPGIMNLTSYGAGDAFVCKLDQVGDLIWVRQMGGIGNEYGSSVSVNSSGLIFTAGAFSGTGDFGIGSVGNTIVSVGGSDFFIQGMNQIVGFENLSKTSPFRVFPNPSSNIVSIELGQVFRRISVKILNSEGQSVGQEFFQETQSLELKFEVPKGLYLLQISVNEETPVFLRVLKN